MQKYNVIDVSGRHGLRSHEEIIAVVEAEDADAAVAAVKAHIGFSAAVIAQDPDGYAEYVLPNRFLMVAAIPAA